MDLEQFRDLFRKQDKPEAPSAPANHITAKETTITVDGVEMKSGVDMAAGPSTTSVGMIGLIHRDSLELIDTSKNAAKFWKIRLFKQTSEPLKNVTTVDYVLEVRWGRIGSTGQVKTWTYSNKREAKDAYHKRYDEKWRKGYRTAAR